MSAPKLKPGDIVRYSGESKLFSVTKNKGTRGVITDAWADGNYSVRWFNRLKPKYTYAGNLELVRSALPYVAGDVVVCVRSSDPAADSGAFGLVIAVETVSGTFWNPTPSFRAKIETVGGTIFTPTRSEWTRAHHADRIDIPTRWRGAFDQTMNRIAAETNLPAPPPIAATPLTGGDPVRVGDIVRLDDVQGLCGMEKPGTQARVTLVNSAGTSVELMYEGGRRSGWVNLGRLSLVGKDPDALKRRIKSMLSRKEEGARLAAKPPIKSMLPYREPKILPVYDTPHHMLAPEFKIASWEQVDSTEVPAGHLANLIKRFSGAKLELRQRQREMEVIKGAYTEAMDALRKCEEATRICGQRIADAELAKANAYKELYRVLEA
jgi:uncharacterized protein YodC (DUF2158 family)